MQREQIERLAETLGGDYYSKQVAARLMGPDGAFYQNMFIELVPKHASLEEWGTIPKIHQMVVTWDPSGAHNWLAIATQPLLVSKAMDTAYSYVKGSLLGLLQAGIWLDENWQEVTPYQCQLLLTLAKIICGPLKLQLHEQNIDANGYGKRLIEALTVYAFPAKTIPGRETELAHAVKYVHSHYEEDKLSPLDRFIIDQLCHGILARKPLVQRVAAANFLLTDKAKGV